MIGRIISFFSRSFPELGHWRDRKWELLTSKNHTLQIHRHRSAVIISRIRLVSFALALIACLWSPFDFMTFSPDLAHSLLITRLCAATVLFMAAWPWPYERSMGLAHFMLAGAVAASILFYLTTNTLVAGAEPTGWGVVAAELYPLFPFAIIAGFSIFPLAAVECVMYLAPVVLFAGLSELLSPNFNLRDFSGYAWLLTLIATVAMVASISQLQYIVTLVNRASMDALTGALTRRSGTETLDIRFKLAQTEDTAIALLFFDIDDFKSINDTYGHEEGDRALRTVSDTLKNYMRMGDTVIRWGGEEFVILLYDINADGIEGVVERITQGGLGERPDGSPLTVSIGAAGTFWEMVDDWPRLVEIADERMYAAKRNGKARCVLANGREMLWG